VTKEGSLEGREGASVLITGAGGYLGRLCLRRLMASPEGLRRVVALDLRDVPADDRLPTVHYERADIRDPELPKILRQHEIETVVHLAFIVTPGKSTTREEEYSVDVQGTENVLDACVETNVRKIIVTSSGAAYGYHADNPQPLTEEDPLRGNEQFAYAHHKRLVEETLARHREHHPELEQLVLRVCTILGERVSNQITDLFEKRFVIDLTGATAPFVFIEDQDVASCIVKGIHDDSVGIYNLAADGTLSMGQIARILGKPRVRLPVGGVQAALWVLKRFGLSQYGPEQALFLQYRPVLSNTRLKAEFGFVPSRNTEEVFRLYARARGLIDG
jgi:UDP-glucose 4-epimerase